MLSAALYRDILAIRCLDNYVCVGVGNCLNLYEIASRKIVAKLEVFKTDNIHNIVKGPATELFIYGGKNLGICELKITTDGPHLDLRFTRRFDDWIIALGWARDGRSIILSILFARNHLRFFNTNNEENRTAWCQERCILYGGSVLANDNGKTIVFSGTVFQEILIWQAENNRKCTNDVTVLHRLKGHRGVIFSVIYDPLLKIISSTSDDRTVRLWRVENKNAKDAKEISWENCDISLTTTMYGHTARVWRSIVRKNRIVSIGEDSLMCVWSLDGNLLDKLEVHNGAEVWSIDVSQDNKYIFTGGADGAVNVWPFESANPLEGCLIYSSDEEKIPKFVFYMQHGNILIFMDGGRLISYDQVSGSFRASLNLPRYSNYCVMQISPDKRKIGLGSKDGCIEIYEEILNEGAWNLQKVFERKVTESKIFSFHWLNDEKIIVCSDGGCLRIIEELAETTNLEPTFILPPCRERWTTAAVIHKNCLICGDRAGNVYIFDLFEKNLESTPTQVFPKIHGRLGVQSFSISADTILSTGRDGTLRSYELDDETKKMKTLHLKKMPMDWVCKILQTSNDTYVLGFKEVEFMIYSTKLKRIVERFFCGGGHRSWDCTIVDEKINFVYIREKRVYELESTLRNINSPILYGHHTKEIYRVEPLETSSSHNIFVSTSEDCTLRLSCIVPDPEAKIHKYRIQNLDTYEGHISNVKCLTVLNLESTEKLTKNLVVSGGGRAQLKIWEMSVRIDGDGISSNDVKCRELFSHMLRGTDKDRKKKWQTIQPAFFVDPETRFMDISAQFYRENSSLVVIFVACSDGYLRIFLYDVPGNILYLGDFTCYCNRCTLRVNTFVHENETILMTMTTDGTVSFWRMGKSIENLVNKSLGNNEGENTEPNRPFSKIKIHQSGINSFDFRKIDDSRWLMLTGGDDNLISLAVVGISLRDDEFFASKLTSWNSSSIHSAQITGAKFVDDKHFLTTGIDQCVVVFSYTYANEVLSVSLLEETITLVPDVQGVALCGKTFGENERLACVYGKGLEVILLKRDIGCS